MRTRKIKIKINGMQRNQITSKEGKEINCKER